MVMTPISDERLREIAQTFPRRCSHLRAVESICSQCLCDAIRAIAAEAAQSTPTPNGLCEVHEPATQGGPSRARKMTTPNATDLPAEVKEKLRQLSNAAWKRIADSYHWGDEFTAAGRYLEARMADAYRLGLADAWETKSET